jgi:hypothetical protein
VSGVRVQGSGFRDQGVGCRGYDDGDGVAVRAGVRLGLDPLSHVLFFDLFFEFLI